VAACISYCYFVLLITGITNKSSTLLATIAPGVLWKLEMDRISLGHAAELRIPPSNNANRRTGAVSTLDARRLLRLQHGCLVFTCRG